MVYMGDMMYQVVVDCGGVVDVMIKVDFELGWQMFQIFVEGQELVEVWVFIVVVEICFGVVFDVDDIVMVMVFLCLFIVFWNFFVFDEYVCILVFGMVVLFDQLLCQYFGVLMVYLLIGVWNVVFMLWCFFGCYFFFVGFMFLIDWGFIYECWFCSGCEYKLINFCCLVIEFFDVKWFFIGDDGQYDEVIYSQFFEEYLDFVVGVVICCLFFVEVVFVGGCVEYELYVDDVVFWVSVEDGVGFCDQFGDVGILY